MKMFQVRLQQRQIRDEKTSFRVPTLGLYICFLVLISSNLSAYADSKDGASLFQGKCVGCHTIGKGALVGPDLAGTKTWSDSDLESNIKRMEKTVGPLSPEDVSNLMAFLKNPSDDSSKASVATTSAPGSNTAAPGSNKASGQSSASTLAVKNEIAEDIGSWKEGSELFDGSRSFSNGGMSCNACHTVNGNGSSMGPDLGNIAEKMNDAALKVACEQTPFKVMKAAYASHPVTKQEAASLVKFFDSIKGRRPRAERIPLTLCSAAGAALLLLVIAFGYRNRNSDVRKKLHRR